MTDPAKKNDVFSPDGVERDKDKDPFSKRAAIKAIPGSGLRHIKDAVGLRTHASKLSREEHGRHSLHRSKSDLRTPQYAEANASQARVDTEDGHPPDRSSIVSSQRTLIDGEPSFTKVLTDTPRDSASSLALNNASNRVDGGHEPSALRNSVAESDSSNPAPTVEDSVADAIYHGVELDERLPIEEAHEVPPLLRRTLSGDHLDLYQTPRDDEWWPRNLSFSIAEENVLRWRNIAVVDVDEEAVDDTDDSYHKLSAKLAVQNMQSEQLKRLHHRLATLSNTDTVWVSSRLADLTKLEAAADTDTEHLDSIYYPRLDTYHALREDAHAAISNNRSQLTVSLRELGNMGDKLDYEISTLRSKVEDVEDALGEFERQIEFVESRAEELDRVLGMREGWWHWSLRVMIGIGSTA
jgi:hypothetical protein